MVTRKLNKRKYRRNKRNTRQRKGKKQTPKLIKCEICSKSKKISRKKLNKLRNAGLNILEALCCGKSDDVEQTTIRPINENNLKPFKFNSKGDYEQLPSWQGDDREEMKMNIFRKKKDGWTVISEEVQKLYDEEQQAEAKAEAEAEAEAERAEVVTAAIEHELRRIARAEAEKAEAEAERVAKAEAEAKEAAKQKGLLRKIMQKLSRKNKNIKKGY